VQYWNYDDFMTRALTERHRDPKREICRWNSLIRTAPLRYEQADSVAQQVGSNIANGVPIDFADTYLTQIAATTAAEATEAYRRYVGTDGLLVVVVGEAKEVRPQLTGLDLGELIDVS